MKRLLCFLAVCAIAGILLHTFLPVYRARRFITAFRSADPQQINALLPKRVSFEKDALVGGGWYSILDQGKLVIGPFPLAAYRDDLTLNLRLDDVSFADWLAGCRSVRVFGPHYSKRFVVSYADTFYRQDADPPARAD